jgi:hypothetical protein
MKPQADLSGKRSASRAGKLRPGETFTVNFLVFCFAVLAERIDRQVARSKSQADPPRNGWEEISR